MVSLENKLLKLGYTELFLRLNERELNSIWTAVNASEQLKNLALNCLANNEARFLAAEILFRKQTGYPSADELLSLSQVYTQALEETKIANHWGLPGELNGLPGEHLVRLGETAVPYLIPLLGNNKKVIFEGSKEATYGNMYQYRLKDFAAFYICQILQIPYQVYIEPEKRDEEIRNLQAQLTEMTQR